jgi:hypothetical protein
MTYKGHVQNGVVVLDEPTDLPDGAEVRVELASGEPTLYQELADIVGIVDGPSDLAEHHDYYAHGKPKR